MNCTRAVANSDINSISLGDAYVQGGKYPCCA